MVVDEFTKRAGYVIEVGDIHKRFKSYRKSSGSLVGFQFIDEAEFFETLTEAHRTLSEYVLGMHEETGWTARIVLAVYEEERWNRGEYAWRMIG